MLSSDITDQWADYRQVRHRCNVFFSVVHRLRKRASSEHSEPRQLLAANRAVSDRTGSSIQRAAFAPRSSGIVHCRPIHASASGPLRDASPIAIRTSARSQRRRRPMWCLAQIACFVRLRASEPASSRTRSNAEIHLCAPLTCFESFHTILCRRIIGRVRNGQLAGDSESSRKDRCQ
jgi:hypothetical protein